MGFDRNLFNNIRSKEVKYHVLLSDLGDDYQKIEFVYLSIRCLGIGSQSSESFLKICTDLGIDNHNLNFVVSKPSSIIIRTTYIFL